MIRSMTGFGRCIVENDFFTQQWEVKSVNSRHLDIKWRMPHCFRFLESSFEKIVRQYAQRGRVEISLSVQYTSGIAPAAAFNNEQANAMLNSLHDLAKSRGHTFIPNYSNFLTISSLWEGEVQEISDETIDTMKEGLNLSLQDWNEARRAEGLSLIADISDRIMRMKEWTHVIEQRAPVIKDERLNTIRERIQDLLIQNEMELEENRFLQEIVIYTDKIDVSEELTRLFTHLERLRILLQTGKDAGKRLEFTLQECFREINTCGNKLPDVQLSPLVVDFKNELEKCREQVQNLE